VQNYRAAKRRAEDRRAWRAGFKPAGRLSILIFFLSFAGNLAAADPDSAHIAPFELPSTRSAALGGNHAALVDDFYNAFNNPAGFGAIEKKISAAEISFAVTSMEILRELYFNKMSMNTILKLIKERVEANAVLGGPFSFGMINKGFGWRVFNVSRANFYWDRNDLFLLNPTFSEEVALNFGYGRRLVDTGRATFDAGLLLKGFYRFAYTPENVFIQEVKHIFTEMKYQPFETQIGGGFDMGVRWTWEDSFSAALTYKDIYSPAYVTRYRTLEKFNQQQMYEESIKTVDSRLGIGIVWRLPSPEMHRYNTDLIFAADYNGLLDLRPQKRDQRLYFSAGLELRFLEVISLRAGFAECLPAGGVGIDFSLFHLDVSYGGKELSDKPRGRSTWFLAVSILFQY
jgi:hypothetical protein